MRLPVCGWFGDVEVRESNVLADGGFDVLENLLQGAVPLKWHVLLGQSSQRGSLVCKLGDEWSHELDYTEKLLNFCDILWSGDRLDFSALFWVRVHAISVVNHSKELDLRCLDETFRSVENKSTFLGNFHKVVEISVMVLVILAVDDDVVGDPDGAWALTEDLIHALLECIL